MVVVAVRSGARTNAPGDRDGLPIPPGRPGRDHRSVFTFGRRLAPLLLSAMLIVSSAPTVAAAIEVPADDPAMLQAGVDLVSLTNTKRAAAGLVSLRIDPALMKIARDRAEVMADNDKMSHTEPDGSNVFDRMNAAGLTWYGAGEIIAWNTYPAEYSTAEAIRAWMASPGHHAIMVSTGYNYVGYGAAISSSGRRYYAGVFAKEPDQTVPWAKFTSISLKVVDSTHKRVTVKWSGGDSQLQVLTSGLATLEVQWRAVGGDWHAWMTGTATSRAMTIVRGVSYEFRIRARDKAGNIGTWRTAGVRP